MAMASGASWLFNSVLVFLFPVALAELGAAAPSATFTAFCALGIVIGVLFAPETKHLPLEAIVMGRGPKSRRKMQ